MTIYLGPVGNLQALPSMTAGIKADLDLRAGVQQALGGARTVDYVGDPKRTYVLDRKRATADELGVLEALTFELYGPGPYALIDPTRRNMLSLNQSSAGDYDHDSTGFSVLAGSVATTGPVTTAAQGRYHQAYTSAASGAAGTSGLLAGRRSTAAEVITVGGATPVRQAVDYTFQARLKHVSGTAASWRAALLWYDVDGALLSTSNGTGAVVTGAYADYSVTAASPSTAAYAVPGVTNDAVLAAVNVIAVDSLMLAQASVVGPWVPGTGVPRVAFTGLGDSYPSQGYHDTALTLVEVG